MKTLLLSVYIVLVLGVSANADFRFFDQRAELNAAAGQTSHEDLNSFTTDTLFSASPLVLEDLSFSVTSGTNDPFNKIDVPPLEFQGFNIDGSPIARIRLVQDETFSIDFDVPMHYFGADFAGLNDDEVRTQIVINGQTILPPPTTGNGVRFFGVGSDASFSSVEFTVMNTSDGFGIDNLVYGTSIPEPNSFCFVLLTMAAMSRRRRASITS